MPQTEPIPTYGSGETYPPCENCLDVGDHFPADLVLEGPGDEIHYVCIDCACTAFMYGGRFDLLASMEKGRRDVMWLRHDPKSPSYRGGL